MNYDYALYLCKCSTYDITGVSPFIFFTAETENVRNRMQKQISDAKVFGIQGFCKDLLEVADILEKAVAATPKDNMSTNQELKDLFDGLTMTESQLHKGTRRKGASYDFACKMVLLEDFSSWLGRIWDALEIICSSFTHLVFGKHGLFAVDPAEGEKFDPNTHEALFQIPVADKEHNTIAVVTQKGFALNGRTLRAAKVGVVKNTWSWSLRQVVVVVQSELWLWWNGLKFKISQFRKETERSARVYVCRVRVIVEILPLEKIDRKCDMRYVCVSSL